MVRRLAGLVTALALLALPEATSAVPGWVAPIDFSVPIAAFSGADEVRYQSGEITNEAFIQVKLPTPLQTIVHFRLPHPDAFGRVLQAHFWLIPTHIDRKRWVAT